MSSDNQTTLTGLSAQAAASSRRGSRSRHGDGGDRGHRGVGHHLPGVLRCPGGGVQTPLLPPPPPAAPLRLQVGDLGLRLRRNPQRLTRRRCVSPVCFRPTVDLIGAMETQSEPSELELDDVVITNPHIEAILENEDWIEDAS